MGNCCRVLEIKKSATLEHHKTIKGKDPTIKSQLAETSFIDIIDKDGNTSQYNYSSKQLPQTSPSEVLNICAETIDLKKTNLQVIASDKVHNLKKKICENLALTDIILIFDGNILDPEAAAGTVIPQGSTLDVVVV